MPRKSARRKLFPFRPMAGLAAVSVLAACGGTAVTTGTESAAAAALGAIDTTFDGDGIVTLDAGTQIKGAVVQPDGKVVLAGYSGADIAPTPYAVRLNADGSRDGSFKPQLPGGIALTDVKLRSDGRLVFSGTARKNSAPDGMVALSLQASGAPDTSFSGDGLAVVASGIERSGEANGVAIAPDGKIVLGGVSYDDKTFLPSATIARLTTDGNPDGALGDGALTASGPSQLNAVAVQADGGIVGVGRRTEGQPVLALVTRVTPAGAVDPGFRGSGSFSTQYAGEGGAFSSFNDVAIDGSGRIVATGTSRRAASAQSVTVRLAPNGDADAFGSGGTRTLDASSSDTFAEPTPGGYGVALDGDRIYVGGTFDIGIAQGSATFLDGAGNLDGGFGTGGQMRFGLGDVAVRGTGGVAFGPNGLYVAGTAGGTGAVARIATVATPDAPNPTTPKPKAPSLTKTSLKPSKITKKKKAKLRYRFSTAGVLTLAVEQKTTGRRATSGKAKGTCGKASSKNRKGKRCTFYAKVGSTRNVTVKKAGSGTLTLSRKVTNRTLKNGTYRLVLQALDPTRKAKGTARRITFKVASR